MEIQLYVRQDLLRRGVGSALWSLMRDMMEMGNRRRVLCRVDRDNGRALAFFQAMGFAPLQGELPRSRKSCGWRTPCALGPQGRKSHQALFGGSRGL